MYIVSHTKGLARYFTSFFFYRPSLLLNTTFSTSFVSLGPTGAWPLPCAATFPHSIGFLQLLYHLLQHGPCTLSRSAPGCVTHHTCHASVTHFRPISGNIVEVTLVTPPIMYINSHTKETYFP